MFGLLKRLPTSGASHAEGPRDEVDELLGENHSILCSRPSPPLGNRKCAMNLIGLSQTVFVPFVEVELGK